MSTLLVQVDPQVVVPQVVTPTVIAPVVLSDSAATFTHYITWPVATMMVALLVAGMLVWNAQTSKNKVDFKDLLLDFDVNRVSLSKFATLMALVITSWSMIAVTVADKMSEGYLLAYGGLWASAGLGVQYLKTVATDKETKLNDSRDDRETRENPR